MAMLWWFWELIKFSTHCSIADISKLGWCKTPSKHDCLLLLNFISNHRCLNDGCLSIISFLSLYDLIEFLIKFPTRLLVLLNDDDIQNCIVVYWRNSRKFHRLLRIFLKTLHCLIDLREPSTCIHQMLIYWSSI